MGAWARNMYSDTAEIKPAQCCIKLVFHLTYTMMHGSTKLKSISDVCIHVTTLYFALLFCAYISELFHLPSLAT